MLAHKNIKESSLTVKVNSQAQKPRYKKFSINLYSKYNAKKSLPYPIMYSLLRFPTLANSDEQFAFYDRVMNEVQKRVCVCERERPLSN